MTTDAELFAALLEMGADFIWNPYNGGYWTLSWGPDNARRHDFHGDPREMVADAHRRWIAAGRPSRQVYTDAEAAAAEARVRQYHEKIADRVLAERHAKGNKDGSGEV